jgi:gluconate kinase
VVAPPPNVAIAVSEQTIKAGENSGYPDLDRDASNWLSALHQRSETAGQIAQNQIITDCTSLRIPLGTYTAPR